MTICGVSVGWSRWYWSIVVAGDGLIRVGLARCEVATDWLGLVEMTVAMHRVIRGGVARFGEA